MKDFETIIKKIKNKDFLPIYFLHGEEPYYIDEITNIFENQIIPEQEKTLAQTIVYGKDTTIANIIAIAQQPPMFSDINMIIVKEAQDLKFDEQETKTLEKYIENPLKTTILIFAYKHKKIDTRKKWCKTLQKNQMIFHSQQIKDYQLAAWIEQKLKSSNINTKPNIANILAEYLGNNLSRIQNEINKLKIILKENQTLDESIIEKHIGISKDFNIFELQKAISTKDHNKAMHIAHFIAQNTKTNPIQMIISNLYTYFSNLIIYQTIKSQPQSQIAQTLAINPYFIKDYQQASTIYPLKYCTRIISILRNTDMKTKGIGAQNTQEGKLLIELTYKILNIEKIKIPT